MSKIEKILSIILVCLFLVSITSCVTKKKFKESQTLLEQRILNQTEQRISQSIQNYSLSATEKLISVIDEKVKESRESTSTNENESTDISVNIKAEEGKEKTATIGNTTVISNGADITVKTTSTKSTDKKLETINKEFTQSLNEERNARISIENEFSEYVKEQNQINESLKAQLDKQSKETDKKGLNLWVWIILVVSALLVLLWFFGGKIPIVARVKSLFRKP